MQKSSQNSQYSEVLHQLKNLSAEDRMVLGLYLYEQLTSEEVNKILNAKIRSTNTVKTKRKPAQRTRFNV
jgi:hypothetical protein